MMTVGTPALNDAIKMLKIGASKNDYPVYCQYVMSKGNYAFTYNNEVFVRVDFPFPWRGSVNIYVLDETLRSLKDNAYNIEQVDDFLRITSGKFKSDIAISSIVPDDEKIKPEIEYAILDKETIESIMAATKFVGGKIYQYIYVDTNNVISTDTSSLFHAITSLQVKTPFGISKSIVPLLSEGVKIGVDKNNNVAVNFGTGYALFTTDSMASYPKKNVMNFLESTTKNTTKVCNFAYIGEALRYISPIFFGENEKILTLRNDGRVLKVSAETKVAGRADYEIVSEMGDAFEMRLDANKLKNITYDYDMYIGDQSKVPSIMLDNTKATIIIVGED